MADVVHFNICKGGNINAKEGVSILLRDFRKAFQPGNGDDRNDNLKSYWVLTIVNTPRGRLTR